MSTINTTGNTPSAPAVQMLSQENGDQIAYCRLEGRGPGIVFLHGLKSDMEGSKALAVEEFCRKHGQTFVRFDCFGHGQSSGAFKDGCMTRWSNDTVDVLDHLCEGPQILVGSSMGGWNMLLSALKRPEQVIGLVGLAAAPDFTEEMLQNTLNAEQIGIIEEQGYIEFPSDYDEEPYLISKTLLEDGHKNLLLRHPIELKVPVRLIHGMQDTDVPWQTSLLTQKMLRSQDVELQLVKNGDHRLSSPRDLKRLERTLEDLLEDLEQNSP